MQSMHMHPDTDVCYAKVHEQIGPLNVQFSPQDRSD